MNARYVHTMSVAGAIAAQALLFLGAGTANAVDPSQSRRASAIGVPRSPRI